MPYASRVVLQLPLSDERLLEAFVEACLIDKVVLIAVTGEGCERIEDIIDEIVVGDGSDPGRFVVTTAHADEPLEDVLEFAKLWVTEADSRVDLVRL
jgi:hypothetical protein